MIFMGGQSARKKNDVKNLAAWRTNEMVRYVVLGSPLSVAIVARTTTRPTPSGLAVSSFA